VLKYKAFLRPLMIRRLKGDEINGVPIVPLLPKSVDTVRVELSEDERYIYDMWIELAEKSHDDEILGELKLLATIINGSSSGFFEIMKPFYPGLGTSQRLRQLSLHPWLLFKDKSSIRNLKNITLHELKDAILAEMAKVAAVRAARAREDRYQTLDDQASDTLVDEEKNLKYRDAERDSPGTVSCSF
jgi:SNF2 family DNA or RNA helicase